MLLISRRVIRGVQLLPTRLADIRYRSHRQHKFPNLQSLKVNHTLGVRVGLVALLGEVHEGVLENVNEDSQRPLENLTIAVVKRNCGGGLSKLTGSEFNQDDLSILSYHVPSKLDLVGRHHSTPLYFI